MTSIKQLPRRVAADLYKRWTLHRLYPSRYRKAVKDRPVDPNKIVFLEVREAHLTDSFLQVYEALAEKKELKLVTVCLREGILGRGQVRANCLAAIEQVADARWILVNDSCYFLSSLPLRPETEVIQLWHACGAFKKFGYSLADKKFGAGTKQLEKFPVHRNFDYVTVSSEQVRWAYAEAFHMPLEKILPTGISRTDVFYDQERIRLAQDKLQSYLKKHGVEDAANKRIVLYAPTFRGRVAGAKSPDELDYGQMRRELGDRYIFLCKHHPFVKKRPHIPEEARSYVFDITDDFSIEEALMVSDVCISDYSSLIFEYSLFEKPMIFYAYDLADYNDWRGFYYSYDDLTPGPVVHTCREVTDCLKDTEEGFDPSMVRAFRDKYMSACDGHVTERLLALMNL